MFSYFVGLMLSHKLERKEYYSLWFGFNLYIYIYTLNKNEFNDILTNAGKILVFFINKIYLISLKIIFVIIIKGKQFVHLKVTWELLLINS